MDFALYYVTAPNNQLDKMSSGAVVEGYSGPATIDVSVMNPTLIIEDASFNFKNANYIYIIDYGRAYYIEDIVVSTAQNIISVKLREDVLQTFKDDILQLNAIVERQSNNYNMYLPDQQIPVDCRKTVTYREFGGNVFGLPYLSLLVLGGSSS